MHSWPADPGFHWGKQVYRRVSEEEILKEFPDPEHEDIREALRYAAEAVRERELPLVGAL